MSLKKAMIMRTDNRSGVVMIVVLWILVILSMLAVSIGHRSSIDLALTKYFVGKMRSKYIAAAGVLYAIKQIEKDTRNADSHDFDTLYQCGFFLDTNETPESLFKGVQVGDGYFDIYDADGQDKYYGLTAEDGKLNINALNVGNQGILRYLFMECDVDQDTAEALSAGVVQKSVSTGMKRNSQSLKFPYGSVEELFFLEGMTEDIFRKIKKYVTALPQANRVLLNFETASEPVLLALAKYFTGNQTNTTEDDARSLVEKIVSYRRGEDGAAWTDDDRPVDINGMGLTAKERTLFLQMSPYRTTVSQYLRVNVQGTDISGVMTSIQAVISRFDLSVVSWQRK